MSGFFRNLFETSDFPARWNCGTWDSFHGWLHILSDIAIWGAYSMIPIALTYYWWSKRDELAFPRLFWLFGAFIFSCGTTHLIEALIFYHPVYRISGLMKLVTAVVSWATVFAIIRIAPRAMELPGMLRINAELQRQLDRNREAEVALARSNRDLEEYAGIVSHDLRNPMGSALFMAELARDSIAAGNTADATEQVELILDSLKKMDRSVKELHSQAMGRKSGASTTPVSLNEVLRAVRAILEPQFLATGAKLNLGELPIIRANRTMIEHLFTNLLENAIKYRSPHRTLVIEVRASENNANAIVTISDNGRGIPEGEHERIFGSEVRASNVEAEPGSGLGLAFCRRVMEESQGTIQARSNELGGAVFELSFPKADDHTIG